MGETKVQVITAVYKVHFHCPECAREIETQFREFQGIHEVKVDAGAGKVIVKGVGYDVEKLRAKVQKGCRKKVELLKDEKEKDKVFEIKTKKEEVKIITIKVPLHCPECEARVKEILLQHKSIYTVKTDLGKNTCVVECALDEKKLTEYVLEKTRKHCTIEKVEDKVIVKEEKVEVVKKKGEVVVKEAKVVKEKVKEVVAPYFIPCTHPRFVDYSHPRWGHYGGGHGCDHCSYGYGSYPCYINYAHSEIKGYQDTAFLHCSHPNEFLSEENPFACSVM